MFFELIRRIREEEERKKRIALTSLLSGLPQGNVPSLLGQALGAPNILQRTRRKVFISYHHSDEDEVKQFISDWGDTKKVFIPKALGVSLDDDFIDSDDPEYVASQIRQKYVGDSSVTIVLIGSCTHSRRYVDWEIKASLRRSTILSPPNGLIGILLPSQSGRAHLPPRFGKNWNDKLHKCYARYHSAPTSADQLRDWIEDAYTARTSRAEYIENPADMMRYSGTCKVCNVTH